MRLLARKEVENDGEGRTIGGARKMLLNNRVDDPEGLHDGVDIVNAEDGCAAQGARNYASDRPGVSIRRVRDLKDVPDHCLSGDREQNWALEPSQ
jgi:hypothetical protein